MSPNSEFDDLDKAVNSLADNVGKSAKPADEPASKEASSQLKPHAKRGRFMDVVHPASDMTTVVPPTSTPADDAAVPYVGKTISPASDDIKPDPVPEKNIDDLPVVKQLSPIDDADPKSLVATPDIAETKKPDPLEVAAKKERERVAREGAKHRKDERKPENKPDDNKKSEVESEPKDDDKTASEADAKNEIKPLFLEDAKVEKRPLGAFNNETKASDDNERPALKTKSDESKKDDVQKVSTPPPPAEFDKAVVELEARDEADLDDSSPATKDPKPEAKNFSIPSQYKQAAKKDNNTAKESSIYEPASYNAFADTHTPSNTKPWMWVIIFLGIVALGVALSLGTFFVVGTN